MLKDKVIVVIGGFGKLGFNFVEFLLNNKAKVVLSDIKFNEEKFKELDHSDVFFVETDITSKESIKNLIEKAIKKFTKIDSVVNSAYPIGKNYGREILQVEYEDYCNNTNLHSGGYFLVTQQFSEYFLTQDNGNIVNISSIYGFSLPDFKMYEGFSKSLPIEYIASKSAILQMSKYFAKYFNGQIKVNCISPGGILNEENQSKEWRERYASYAQRKGMLDRKDINGALLFLLSDMSEFVNGQEIIVDDGISL